MTEWHIIKSCGIPVAGNFDGVMSVPVFSFQIKYDILPGLVTVGKYDGSHSCLTAATTGAKVNASCKWANRAIHSNSYTLFKVLIHSPHKYNNPVSFLNVNESVTAICAGRLKPDEDKDILAIGSSSSILAYHVDNNSELFFKEVGIWNLWCLLIIDDSHDSEKLGSSEMEQVPDGVTAITIGLLENFPSPLLIIGGNCSIQGFDWKGQDLYWTVTGDNVRSLALLDFNQDGFNEVYVHSYLSVWIHL